jgi:hypothetical protein
MKQNRISVFIAVALIGVIAAAFVASPPKASAQTSNPVSVVTYPDLTGNGAAQRIASSGTCRIIDVAALPANNAAVRIGDINVGASRGLPIIRSGRGFPSSVQSRFDVRLCRIGRQSECDVSVSLLTIAICNGLLGAIVASGAKSQGKSFIRG